MKYPIVSIRDVKVGFMSPQAEQSEQTAIRGFSYAMNHGDGIMSFSPKDFDLYKIADFDTETGKIEPITPTVLVSGVNVYGVDAK